MLTLKKVIDKDYNLAYEFEKGERAGEKYIGEIRVCANPVCTCERVNFVAHAVGFGFTRFKQAVICP